MLSRRILIDSAPPPPIRHAIIILPDARVVAAALRYNARTGISGVLLYRDRVRFGYITVDYIAVVLSQRHLS